MEEGEGGAGGGWVVVVGGWGGGGGGGEASGLLPAYTVCLKDVSAAG